MKTNNNKTKDSEIKEFLSKNVKMDVVLRKIIFSKSNSIKWSEALEILYTERPELKLNEEFQKLWENK